MVDTHMARRDITDARVLDAARQVPRHRFVPRSQRRVAYDDRPLPIGHGATISQPYIVALMAQELRLGPGDRRGLGWAGDLRGLWRDRAQHRRDLGGGRGPRGRP